jgi:hypothetical protein
MEESINKFVQFIYYLIDLIRDLVVSVSGKGVTTTEPTDESTPAEE